MKNLFRRTIGLGGKPATEIETAASAPVLPTQPEPTIAEAIPLDIQKRMLHNIRRNLHSKPVHHPS